MRILLWLVVVAVAVVAFDRLGLWAERRGWIFYRTRKPSPGSVGSALLQAQALLEPQVRYVVEERRERPAEDQDAGDPPSRAGSRA